MTTNLQFHNENFSRYDKEISNIRKRKQPKGKSFIKYCKSLLKESKLTGISSLITSKSCFRKLFKFLILATGIIGFLIQTQEYLELYWQYSTAATERKIGKLKKPAITICDDNLIRRRYLCETRPHMCQNNNYTRDEFCSFRASTTLFCVDTNDFYIKTLHPDVDLNQEELLNINFTKIAGFQIKNVECEWLAKVNSERQTTGVSTTNSCGLPHFVRGMSKEKLPGACYTLKSSQYTLEEDMQNNYLLRMNVQWRASELLIHKTVIDTYVNRTRVYWIQFHYPGRVTNPFVEGFQLQEGKSHRVKLTQIDTIRLPYPYSTNCFDYVKAWKENKFQGPLGKKDCIANCEVNIRLQEFGCVPRNVLYSHDKKLCVQPTYTDIRLKGKIQKCKEKCREACTETEYIAENTTNVDIDISTGIEEFGNPHVARLQAYFDIAKSKTVVYRPKYESVELFSYIGGYLGMWLGWSLLAVFDFFEILLNICMFPFIVRRRIQIQTKTRKSVAYY